jgi:gluconokinase
MIVLVMGVSGSGKTTIGEALALELGWKYMDADDFHSRENVAKMAAGIALEDADRRPWLDRINAELLKMQKQDRSAVVGCSALKHAYRERLARGLRDFEIVYLRGDFKLLQSRIAARKHRFMPPTLLQSQFDVLEPPAYAIDVDVSAPVESSLSKIKQQLRQS